MVRERDGSIAQKLVHIQRPGKLVTMFFEKMRI